MSAKKVTKKELLAKAAEINLKGVSKLRKDELIHAIQTGEGNVACFSTISNCGESNCLYFGECQA